MSSSEIFEFYKHPYSEYKDFDLSLLPKKWQRHVGGAISLEPRIKYEIREQYPGPGRYDPNIKPTKAKPPEYYFGEKGNITCLRNITGTSEKVGPSTYKVEEAVYTSKHVITPHWTLPHAERRGLATKLWTKNETYYLYKYLNNNVVLVDFK